MLLLLSALGLLIVAVQFIPTDYYARIATIPATIRQGSETVGTRYELWTYAIELWRSSPIFGVGPGIFFSLSGASIRNLQGANAVAHNMYVSLLCENGIIGLALFLAVIVGTFRNFWATRRIASADAKLRGLSAAWEAIALFLVLSGLKADFGTHKILWTSFGVSNALLALAATKVTTAQRADVTGTSRAGRQTQASRPNQPAK
jgi:O-antigen ligase